MSEELVAAKARLQALYRIEPKGTDLVNKIVNLEEKIARLEYREKHPNLIEQFFNFIEEAL